MKLVPARLEPVFRPLIWGARSLAPLFPDKIALAEPVGEVWLTGEECCFATGPFTGRKLGDAWREMPLDWAGTRMDTRCAFPLLVKFLFTEQKLSIQVHPDDDYARQHEAARGGRGKTEMWYVIHARPGAELMVGLRPGVTPELFRRAIVAGTAEECLEHIPVSARDAVFIPARTLHTAGPGLILCEIQETSDVTYRVYDYDRVGPDGKPRPLHIEQAMAVINFGTQHGGKLQPLRVARGYVTETYFIACRYFATEKWEFAQRIGGVTLRERFELFVVLEGNGAIQHGGESADYAPGQVWLLPAALGAYQIEPASRTTLLRTYVPDISNDFLRRLRNLHVEETTLSRLVHP